MIRETESLERERSRTLADLHTEKSRIRTIIESLPNGVMVTNVDGEVVLMNPAFRWNLGMNIDYKPGAPVEAYVSDPTFCELIREISQGKHVDYDDLPTYEFSPSSDRYLIAKAQPIISEKRSASERWSISSTSPP